MIKCCHMTFEEVDVENHWITFPVFGRLLSSEINHYDCSPSMSGIHLNPEDVYQIAMDQSSSNTGIFIKNYKNTEAYMIELRREKGMTAEDYLWDFEMFLHSLCEGCTLTHLIYERPIEGDSFRSAQVLFQLEGIVIQLPRRYKEFRNCKLDNIENAAWRKAMNVKRFANMGKKEASKWAVRDIFPWASEYGESLYKDNDIFESIGVMMGWFACSFDHLGRPYVRGATCKSTVGGFVLPNMKAEDVSEMLKAQGIESLACVENPGNSICKNLTSGIMGGRIFCVEFSSQYAMLALHIECNLKWEEPEVMTVILMEASSLNPKLEEITGPKFHFIL